LWVKQRAYPRVEQGSGLTHKHNTMLGRLAKDEYSSLLRAFVNYG
jgi:hypothetical protein